MFLRYEGCLAYPTKYNLKKMDINVKVNDVIKVTDEIGNILLSKLGRSAWTVVNELQSQKTYESEMEELNDSISVDLSNSKPAGVEITHGKPVAEVEQAQSNNSIEQIPKKKGRRSLKSND
jgi:hypothetical protein